MITFREKIKTLCKPGYRESRGNLVSSWCNKFNAECSSKTCRLGEPHEIKGPIMTNREAYDKGWNDLVDGILHLIKGISSRGSVESWMARYYDPPKEEDASYLDVVNGKPFLRTQD